MHNLSETTNCQVNQDYWDKFLTSGFNIASNLCRKNSIINTGDVDKADSIIDDLKIILANILLLDDDFVYLTVVLV